MKDVSILPVFNQSAPGVWDDFLHIRATAMSENYNCPLSVADIERYRSEYMLDWKRCKKTFAFAAYDDMKMVGFARGYCVGGHGVLRCLYVLPSYQGEGIGKHLLSRVENSVSIHCKSMELVALGCAEKFYAKNGYHPKFYNSNEYQKTMRTPHCSTIALFGASAQLVKMCQALAPDINVGALLKSTPAAFGYIDEHGTMSRFLITSPDTNTPIYSHQAPDIINRVLSRSYDYYIQHRIRRGH